MITASEVSKKPGAVQFHNNLATVCKALGRTRDAIAHYHAQSSWIPTTRWRTTGWGPPTSTSMKLRRLGVVTTYM